MCGCIALLEAQRVLHLPERGRLLISRQLVGLGQQTVNRLSGRCIPIQQSFVGRTLRVLVEGEAGARELRKANVSSWEHGLIREVDNATKQLKGRYLIARGEADAPDIDGRVYVRVPTGKMPVGKFAKVKIIGHTDYDLIAEPE